MKKPDRFERMVDACNFNDRSDAADAVKLLRLQHRAMVRMVKDMPRVPCLASDSLMRSDVIEALTQYAK